MARSSRGSSSLARRAMSCRSSSTRSSHRAFPRTLRLVSTVCRASCAPASCRSPPAIRRTRAEMATLAEVADYLDTTLNVAAIPDYPGAMNGIQLGTTHGITQVATAVDFASVTAHGAIDAGAQLLLVHHGMFWGGAQPIVGLAYDRLKALLVAGVAVYASHLPLDVHPELGNNALLARELGF